MQSPQESPATPEVQITGFKNFNASCSTMAKEVDDIYNASCSKVTKEVDDINNDPGISCFKKCEMIGLNLGSSSAGKQPRRPRCIIQPNSYYRNFQTNKCNTRFIVSPQDLLAYECILFYGSHREYARLLYCYSITKFFMLLISFSLSCLNSSVSNFLPISVLFE